MLKILPILSLIVCTQTYSGIDNAYYAKPYDYSINTKDPVDSAFNGYQRGLNMASQIESAKQQRELHQIKMAQIKREEDYRNELKQLYEHPEARNSENLQRIIILYPEYSETTLKLKDSLEKLGDK